MRAQDPTKYSLQISGLPTVRENVNYNTARTPADVAELCKDLQPLAQEAFVVITLNTRNNVIDKQLITLGLLDASLVHPREVFRKAIGDGAFALILVHNHPSGDPSPSSQDIRITKQLIDAGKIIDIKVLDHIIIGKSTTDDPGYVSIRESRAVSF